MNSYDVIVGANNDTYVVEVDRIIEITSRYYGKHMVIPNVVSVEDGTLKTISSDYLIKLAKELKTSTNYILGLTHVSASSKKL